MSPRDLLQGIINKTMWRFLADVSKPKSKRKQSGDCPRPSTSKEKKKKYDVNYDIQRQRKTWDRWVHGRPRLLINDGIMTCTEHEDNLKPLGLLISRNFIDGCDIHKAQSISFHEKSRAHKKADVFFNKEDEPEVRNTETDTEVEDNEMTADALYRKLIEFSTLIS